MRDHRGNSFDGGRDQREPLGLRHEPAGGRPGTGACRRSFA
jgi:hypothetical protein